MTSPLTSQLASQIYKAMKSTFLDATLTRDTITSSPDYDPADPPAPIPVTYSCKAIRDNYSAYDMLNSMIATGDAKLLILAGSIAVTPQGNDRITIQGTMFSIINVKTDPAVALFECQGRQ